VASQAVEIWPDLPFLALVITEKGYGRALAAGCRVVAVVVIASEFLSGRNSRMGVEESLQVCLRVVQRTRRDGVGSRVYLSPAWGCAYEGPIAHGRVVAIAELISDAGPDGSGVADFVGQAHPGEVKRLMEILGSKLGGQPLAVPLQDTRGLGLANAAAAIFAGVRTLAASIGGLGGCPFAADAVGNLAREDLALLARKMGLVTGVNLPAICKTGGNLDRILGRRIGSRSRARWESCGKTSPDFAP